IATLWGPVRSEALGTRATVVTSQVRGVRQVHNELSIIPPTDDSPEALADPRRESLQAPRQVPPPAGTLTGRPSEPLAAPQTGPASTAHPSGDVVLLPPIIIPAPPASSVPAPPATLWRPVPLKAVPTSEELSAAIDQIRRGEARFGGVQWELHDRVVTLNGT